MGGQAGALVCLFLGWVSKGWSVASGSAQQEDSQVVLLGRNAGEIGCLLGVRAGGDGHELLVEM